MEIVLNTIACLSAFFVLYRTIKILKGFRVKSQNLQNFHYPAVSIIVPVRDEEENIGRLLKSLQSLNYPDVEIVVCNDGSKDNTAAVVKKFDVCYIEAPPKPKGWLGKSWACHHAVRYANGKLLLFTDADTVHRPDSLMTAVQHLHLSKASLVSANSYHRNELWWEKLLGPFYFILQIAISPSDKITTNNPYAVGQYILIPKDAYLNTTGHAAIREEVAEDTALVNLFLKHNLKTIMHQGQPLFEVQMYRSFDQFCTGWIRILRVGMRALSFSTILYSILPLVALNAFNIDSPSWFSLTPLVMVVLSMLVLQRFLGRFSIWGPVLFPVGVVLFVSMSLIATLLEVLKAPITWRGRIYQATS